MCVCTYIYIYIDNSLIVLNNFSLEYISKGLPYPPSGYEELDVAQMNSNHDHYNRIISPGDCYG